MKTPKRDYKDYHWLPDCAERPDLHELESIKEHTRWKRKNRVAQLKATIARLRAENTHLRIELAEALTECYSGYHKGVEVGFSQGFKHGSRELIKLEMLNTEHRKEESQQ